MPSLHSTDSPPRRVVAWFPWLIGALVLAGVVTAATTRSGEANDDSAGGGQALLGTVVDIDGRPIQGALITDGSSVAVTGADGVFMLPASAPSTDPLRVSASGFADTTVTFGSMQSRTTVTMRPQPIKAIYLDPDVSYTDEAIDRLIGLVNATEINSVVIDVKEETVFLDSQVGLFRNAGSVAPILDLPTLLKRLDANSIYAIARLVVFKDSSVAEARPDLAVRDSRSGGIWRDANGSAWVNPMRHELWDANVALAVEATGLGFDEVQFDYIRFPTDGDVEAMDFGEPATEQARVTAITGFLQHARQALLPTGAKLSADVFGYTTMVAGDLGIGQDLTQMAPLVDYLSPMVYPSHFPDRSLALAGHPNDSPYETVAISLSSGRDQLGSALQMRPWLQDFTYRGMTPYGASQVRAQIDAAEEIGTSGWMLWNSLNLFTTGALGPDDGNMRRFEPPRVVLPGASAASSGAGRTGKRANH